MHDFQSQSHTVDYSKAFALLIRAAALGPFSRSVSITPTRCVSPLLLPPRLLRCAQQMYENAAVSAQLRHDLRGVVAVPAYRHIHLVDGPRLDRGFEALELSDAGVFWAAKHADLQQNKGESS